MSSSIRQPSGELVTVFGGSGFIGRHVVRALARQGRRIRVAVRRPDLAFHLQPLGGVGQIQPVQANLRNRASVARAVAGADAVINLVGIMHQGGRQRFDAVHGFGARAVAEAAAAAGVPQLVHVSALGASPDSGSAYARSKANAERAVLDAFPGAVILRPSVVFGPEDRFFNRFAQLATFLPVIPLVGADTRVQPVFVGDVAEAAARALDGAARPGATYELAGPEVMTIREAAELTLRVIRRRRALAGLPFGLAKLQAFMLEVAHLASLGLLPDSLRLTRDQVELLRHDNVLSDEAVAENRTLAGLGVIPQGVEGIIPTYLWRFRKKGQFEPPPKVGSGAREAEA
ncbi:complex I NDUFA9 subunit family protein [Camelimonas abortus]|uniref:Complex I NDUFA9 subunit family protein n=1 Tax=Camelimonas abortus TaxID=1017184 RepID=A0ABV7LF29_9HYPH